MTAPREHGSLADEAAQLVGAAQAWLARATHAEPAAADDVWSHATADKETDQPPECAVCPLCRSIRFARNVQPEAVEQIVAAGTALVAALKDAGRQADDRPAQPQPDPPNEA